MISSSARHKLYLPTSCLCVWPMWAQRCNECLGSSSGCCMRRVPGIAIAHVCAKGQPQPSEARDHCFQEGVPQQASNKSLASGPWLHAELSSVCRQVHSKHNEESTHVGVTEGRCRPVHAWSDMEFCAYWQSMSVSVKTSQQTWLYRMVCCVCISLAPTLIASSGNTAQKSGPERGVAVDSPGAYMIGPIFLSFS